MTQTAMVLAYLRTHPQGLSQLEAYAVLPQVVTNLSARISDLDRLRFDIYRARVDTVDGKHHVFYVLRGEPEAQPQPVEVQPVPVQAAPVQVVEREADPIQEALL
jgi:hypothetical protein